jgi:hypothetical protein
LTIDRRSGAIASKCPHSIVNSFELKRKRKRSIHAQGIIQALMVVTDEMGSVRLIRYCAKITVAEVRRCEEDE